MRIHNLYVDDKGESHWRDIEVEWVDLRDFSKMSKRLSATGITFRETGDQVLGWHAAARRQYIINLDGCARVTTSDGECREIGPGAVVLIEDTHGKGHKAEWFGRKVHRTIVVTLE